MNKRDSAATLAIRASHASGGTVANGTRPVTHVSSAQSNGSGELGRLIRTITVSTIGVGKGRMLNGFGNSRKSGARQILVGVPELHGSGANRILNGIDR